VADLEKGYEYEGRKIKFDDSSGLIYEYLLMVREKEKMSSSESDIAKKINFLLAKLNFHHGFDGYTSEAFAFDIKNLALEKEEKERLDEYDGPG